MTYAVRIRDFAAWILEKLAGAGFASALFALYVLVASGFDLYDFSEMLSEPFSLAFVFYVYGVACALLIDGLGRLFRGLGMKGKASLYILAGYAFFLVREIGVITVIAGTVGALCALVFLAGTMLSKGSRPFKYGFAIVVPLLLLSVMNIDFTERNGWTQTVDNESFAASFDYFNGRHEIPVPTERGERIAFRVRVDNANGGGHGFHVLDDANRKVPMHRGEGADELYFRADGRGNYRIVITGDGLQGAVSVTWGRKPGPG